MFDMQKARFPVGFSVQSNECTGKKLTCHGVVGDPAQVYRDQVHGTCWHPSLFYNPANFSMMSALSFIKALFVISIAG